MVNGLTPAEVQAIKQEIFASLHCALPGMVESFDEDAGTACIRLALSKLPVLRDVPVFAGNDVHIGDLCLAYGGGGHANAGTCQLENDVVDTELPVIIEKLNGRIPV